ncbi:MAG: hypothetical protein H7Y38_11435 [Armatimonadetes bacterium]|nr:hypothetical protein [Armatimonadota bacterium]
MFVGTPDVLLVQTYLRGIAEGFMICGYAVTYSSSHPVVRQRGWVVGTDGLIAAMERGGLTGQAAIAELIAIESKKWEDYRDFHYGGGTGRRPASAIL